MTQSGHWARQGKAPRAEPLGWKSLDTLEAPTSRRPLLFQSGLQCDFAQVSNNSSHLTATFNALFPHGAIMAPFRRSARVRILLSTLSYNTSVGSRFFLSLRDIRKNEPNGHKKYSKQEWH
jgi:hypothetical protein